ncbi:MAG: RNA polymerase sigma factor [Chloroflexi bacterium]|nr:RNA polymerase sigma factor [Chloroflexota bacterium]
MYNPVTIVELTSYLTAATLGDEDACAWLYHRFSSRVFRFAVGLLGDADDAEEVTQDAFVYAFRNLRRFDATRSSFGTWLFTIAISRCRNKRRRKWLESIPLHLWEKRGQHVGASFRRDDREVESALEARGVRRHVWAAVRALSPKLREAIALRYFGELSYVEMGRVIGISPKTAESRVRLGLKAIRERLTESELELEWEVG